LVRRGTLISLPQQWQQVPEGRQRDNVFALLWAETRGLRDLLLSKHYIPGSDYEEGHSILLVKFMNTLAKFDATAGRSYRLKYGHT
jgi:hypothetical protein